MSISENQGDQWFKKTVLHEPVSPALCSANSAASAVESTGSPMRGSCRGVEVNSSPTPDTAVTERADAVSGTGGAYPE